MNVGMHGKNETVTRLQKVLKKTYLESMKMNQNQNADMG